jgi:hypothetical protein
MISMAVLEVLEVMEMEGFEGESREGCGFFWGGRAADSGEARRRLGGGGLMGRVSDDILSARNRSRRVNTTDGVVVGSELAMPVKSRSAMGTTVCHLGVSNRTSSVDPGAQTSRRRASHLPSTRSSTSTSLRVSKGIQFLKMLMAEVSLFSRGNKHSLCEIRTSTSASDETFNRYQDAVHLNR